MNPMITFGEDMGMGANKLYGPKGGTWVQSLVAADNGQVLGPMLGFRNRKPPLRIRVDGITLWVGAEAHDWGQAIENLDYDRMSGVPETRAIFYANLTRYMERFGLLEAPIKMIVGLPLEPLTGSDSQANAEIVRKWIQGEHFWEAGGKPYHVTISEAKITSQPSGALFDYLLDEEGSFIPERSAHFSQEVGVIAIGFNTLELLTVKERVAVQGMTAGRTLGVRRLLELVNNEGLYTLGESDSKLRAGSLDIKAALPVWAREINGQIEKTWGQRWKRYARVIIVGGGALLLRNLLTERFAGKAFLPDDPVMAISWGLYKLALMQQNRSSQPHQQINAFGGTGQEE